MATHDVFELQKHLGEEIAVSDWIRVEQPQIMQFAELTGDHFWIHTDPERAKRESPFKTTIAHGFFTLSLIAGVMDKVFELTGFGMAVNYGLDKVRFMGPVPAGSRVRVRFTVGRVAPIEGGIRVTWLVTVEREGEAKPALVAELVSQFWK